MSSARILVISISAFSRCGRRKSRSLRSGSSRGRYWNGVRVDWGATAPVVLIIVSQHCCRHYSMTSDLAGIVLAAAKANAAGFNRPGGDVGASALRVLGCGLLLATRLQCLDQLA